MKITEQKSFLLAILSAILLSACGSMQTLGPGAKEDLATNKQYRATKCETIPRTYSGVAYVLCTAYLKQVDDVQEGNDEAIIAGNNKSKESGKGLGGVPGASLLDLLLSGVVDTILLPYTLYKQLEDGSYRLNVDPDIEATANPLPRKDY